MHGRATPVFSRTSFMCHVLSIRHPYLCRKLALLWDSPIQHKMQCSQWSPLSFPNGTCNVYCDKRNLRTVPDLLENKAVIIL